MKAVNRRYDAQMDQKILLAMFKHYIELPKSQRLASLDKFFNIEQNTNEQQFQAKLAKMYQATKLSDQETRLAWMNKAPVDFTKSSDPFIQLAVETYTERKKIEETIRLKMA